MGEICYIQCQECGYRDSITTGRAGFGYDQEYRDTVLKIKAGQFGQEWKKLFESTPGAVVEADRELFVCPSCGTYQEGQDLTIYEPAMPFEPKPSAYPPEDPYLATEQKWLSETITKLREKNEYTPPRELRGWYKVVKAYEILCPKCGISMRKYTDGEKIKCPKCEDGWMERDDSRGTILFD